jgi:hypothetical protein
MRSASPPASLSRRPAYVEARASSCLPCSCQHDRSSEPTLPLRRFDPSGDTLRNHALGSRRCGRTRGADALARRCERSNNADLRPSRVGAPIGARLSDRFLRGTGERSPAPLHPCRQGGHHSEVDKQGPLLGQAQGGDVQGEGGDAPGRDGTGAAGGSGAAGADRPRRLPSRHRNSVDQGTKRFTSTTARTPSLAEEDESPIRRLATGWTPHRFPACDAGSCLSIPPPPRTASDRPLLPHGTGRPCAVS